MKALVMEEVGKPMVVKGVARAQVPRGRRDRARGRQRDLPLGLASMAGRLGLDWFQAADADDPRT